MKIAGRPVVGAGVLFVVYGISTVLLGHALRTSAMTAAGLDSINDGAFFIFGGVASWLMLRSSAHWVSCKLRAWLNVASIGFGLTSYTIGTFAQESTNADLSQAKWSVALGAIGAVLNGYWYWRVKRESGEHGFRWNLLANVIGDLVLIPAGYVAYKTGHAEVNFWAAILALAVTMGFAVQPIWELRSILLHSPDDCDAAVLAAQP